MAYPRRDSRHFLGILLHNSELESTLASLLIKIGSVQRTEFEKDMLEVAHYDGRDN